jgi:DNA-binding beta-propeller fold protein YncE
VGEFQNPEAVAVELDGTVWVADTGNDRIQGFTPDGTPRWQWGHRGRSVEQLDAPSGLAIDATGALVIADANNHRIHRVGADDLRTSR